MGHIRYEVRDRVATVTVDRPEKRNAMTFAVLAEFHEAIARASGDDGVGAVVITGAGGAFCAGTDLADLADTPVDQRSRRGGESARTAGDGSQGADGPRGEGPGPGPWPIVACPKPVIAAVFLSAEQHATMMFRSLVTRAVVDGGDDYQLDGELTLNGVTRPVTLDVEFLGLGTNPVDGSTHAGFAATTALDREDFGVDLNVPLGMDKVALGNKVTVELELQFVAPTP